MLPGVLGAREERAREGRLQLALLRGVLDNLKPNRVMIPIFAAAICAMFWPWVSAGMLATWFGLVMLSLLPQHFITRMVPNNPANPDPTTEVRYGDQSWEEMMFGFFDVSFPVKDGKEEKAGAE